jgi:hypothetical protein
MTAIEQDRTTDRRAAMRFPQGAPRGCRIVVGGLRPRRHRYPGVGTLVLTPS